MRISIAMATFNGEKYLWEQLNSFAAQTRLPDELVITDDCSSDRTIGIVRKFMTVAPFEVRLDVNETTLGYCGNFNRALLNTNGDLVFLSDQDDLWFPQKIERMAAFAAEDKCGLVYMNDAELTDSDLNPLGLTKLGQIDSAGLKKTAFVMGCCVAVKRDLLKFCLPIPEAYPAHDAWIVGLAMGMGRKRIMREVLQYYRRHAENQSQIISNRVTRVTRRHVLALKFRELAFERKAALLSPPCESSILHGSPESIMLGWLESFEKTASGSWTSDLMRFRVQLQKHVDALAKRALIRKLPLPKRAIEAIKFWWSGGYFWFLGAKSLLRDIVAP